MVLLRRPRAASTGLPGRVDPGTVTKGLEMVRWWQWSGLPAVGARALGLDIGHAAVHLVALGRSPRGALMLHGQARVSLTVGAVVDGQVEQFDTVARALVQACAQLRLRTRRVVMALPAASVLQRTVRLDRHACEGTGSGAQLQAMAAGLVPLAVEDLALDFAVVGPAPDNAVEVEMRMAVARLDRVQDRLALAEAAGLEPVVIEPECHATQRACQAWWQRTQCAAPTDTLALVEWDPPIIRLTVMGLAQTLFELEQVWRDQNGHEQFAQEVGRLLRQFRDAVPGQRLACLLLAGDAAGQAGLEDALAQASGLRVVPIDPFAAMAVGPQLNRPDTKEHAGTYLQACGLALRGLEP